MWSSSIPFESAPNSSDAFVSWFMASWSASLRISAFAALRPARIPGSSETGWIMKFIRLTNMITVPDVTPFPFIARNTPMKNTPIWARMPEIMPSIVIRMRTRFFLYLPFSRELSFFEKRSNMRFSALKLLTTEKPPRHSESIAVKSLFLPDTMTSSFASFVPVRSETTSGISVTRIADPVRTGLK